MDKDQGVCKACTPLIWPWGSILEAEAYSIQTRNGEHKKVSMLRSPTGYCLDSYLHLDEDGRDQGDHLDSLKCVYTCG